MRFIHLGQQLDISPCVQAREAASVVSLFLDISLPQILPDQPCHLCPAETRHLNQLTSQQPFPSFSLCLISLSHQGLLYPPVNLLPILPFKSNSCACLQKCLDLLQA